MSAHPDGTSAVAVRPAQRSRHDAGDLTDAASGAASLRELLGAAQARGASDLLLVADAPPTVYCGGSWKALDRPPMSAEAVAQCVEPHLNLEQRDRLHNVRDLDVGLAFPGLGRYRVNVHFQRGGMAAAIRAIPVDIPPFERLGLPPQVLSFAEFPSGLVLVTGGTGQGKSTTLAALIDHINRRRAAHVITIEDPVEFAFANDRCLIEQRQVGDDAPTFASALRHVLRQRPDVILIGEMRDLETMCAALTAAETGHLVLTTLHTSSAAQTIARIIDVFPPTQQAQVRTQLAASLRAILCQSLVMDALNETLVPVTEIMFATSAVRRAIRDNETHLIYSMIETGRRDGMHTIEQSLAELHKAGRITQEQALATATDANRMRRMLGLRADVEPA